MTADQVAGELRSGMTIGIGGWGGRRAGRRVGVGGGGSRQKPMALVRAILRAGLTDLTVVSFGGPDVGLLVASGRVRRGVLGVVSLGSIPLGAPFPARRR